MKAFAFMEKKDNVIIPAKPRGKGPDGRDLSEDWADAYFKAVQNNDGVEVYASSYIYKTRKGEENTKIKNEINIVERENDSDTTYVSGGIVSDVAYYMTSDAVSMTERMELDDIVQEYKEIETEVLECENVWLFPLIFELLQNGANNSKRSKEIVDTLEELNVTPLVMDIISNPYVFSKIQSHVLAI